MTKQKKYIALPLLAAQLCIVACLLLLFCGGKQHSHAQTAERDTKITDVSGYEAKAIMVAWNHHISLIKEKEYKIITNYKFTVRTRYAVDISPFSLQHKSKPNGDVPVVGIGRTYIINKQTYKIVLIIETERGHVRYRYTLVHTAEGWRIKDGREKTAGSISLGKTFL
jgi:hypothetical protein